MKKMLLKVLKLVNWVVAIVAIVSALALDSASWTPYIVLACCLAYGGCAMYIKEVIKEGEA